MEGQPRSFLPEHPLFGLGYTQPVIARALEPEPAWHGAAALDSLGEAGPITHFSVAAGDTVELEL